MKVLIACEESQRVCLAFRERGHEAYSCDILECSGGHPEWHIQGDVLRILNGASDEYYHESFFFTQDGKCHSLPWKWDLIIAFPPCIYLTNTGNRWFNVARYGDKALLRFQERAKAIDFFMSIVNCNCEKIAIENPIGCMSTVYRKPDQIIQPYYFAEYDGDENCERKSTCLWLKGLPCLTYKSVYNPRVYNFKNGNGSCPLWHISSISLPSNERSKFRSKTYPGIAVAMALQWG